MKRLGYSSRFSFSSTVSLSVRLQVPMSKTFNRRLRFLRRWNKSWADLETLEGQRDTLRRLLSGDFSFSLRSKGIFSRRDVYVWCYEVGISRVYLVQRKNLLSLRVAPNARYQDIEEFVSFLYARIRGNSPQWKKLVKLSRNRGKL